jgi:hypothetical protein
MRQSLCTESREPLVKKEHVLVGTVLLLTLTVGVTSLRLLIVQGLIDVANVFLQVVQSFS